jgi:hypothetical protein
MRTTLAYLHDISDEIRTNSVAIEPTLDVDYIADLPLDVNVPFMGRG